MTSHNEKQTNQTKNTPHNQKPTHNHQNLVIPEKVKRWDNPGSQWVCKNPGSQTFFSDKYIRRMPRCNAFHRSTFTSLGKREMHIAMPEHCLASLLSFSFQVEYSCRVFENVSWQRNRLFCARERCSWCYNTLVFWGCAILRRCTLKLWTHRTCANFHQRRDVHWFLKNMKKTAPHASQCCQCLFFILHVIMASQGIECHRSVIKSVEVTMYCPIPTKRNGGSGNKLKMR